MLLDNKPKISVAKAANIHDLAPVPFIKNNIAHIKMTKSTFFIDFFSFFKKTNNIQNNKYKNIPAIFELSRLNVKVLVLNTTLSSSTAL